MSFGHLLRLQTLAASFCCVNNFFVAAKSFSICVPSALASGGLELKGKPR